MYQTNLSYVQLKTYLALLNSQKMIEQDSELFVTTEKGYRFVEAFHRVNDVLAEQTEIVSKEIVRERYREVSITKVVTRRPTNEFLRALSTDRKLREQSPDS